MKSRAAVMSFSVLAVCTSIALSGCNTSDRDIPDNSQSSNVFTSSTSTFAAPVSTEESHSETPTIETKGEVTVFTGPDGIPIYTEEITSIEGTEKTAAELTKTDYGTSVICEGFQYFTEPSGVEYNNYQNSEMFDDYLFIGETPENKKECRKVKVGEEICGLKLIDAVSEFKIDDYDDTPEPYYYDGYMFADVTQRPLAKLDGSVTIEGFLGVTSRNDYEPDGGLMFFNPTESKLPVLGEQSVFYERSNYVGSSCITYGDMPEIQCGNIRDLSCSTAGLDIGDVAFVRITLCNIEYSSSQYMSAEIENIERLSDILEHSEDTI